MLKHILILASLIMAAVGTAAEPSRPNFIFVLVDDMGWADFSCFGNTAIKTENTDRLAAEGLRFSQFYVNSPICSPSRTASPPVNIRNAGASTPS